MTVTDDVSLVDCSLLGPRVQDLRVRQSIECRRTWQRANCVHMFTPIYFCASLLLNAEDVEWGIIARGVRSGGPANGELVANQWSKSSQFFKIHYTSAVKKFMILAYRYNLNDFSVVMAHRCAFYTYCAPWPTINISRKPWCSNRCSIWLLNFLKCDFQFLAFKSSSSSDVKCKGASYV